jgi:2-hydroxy-6-oxonona-2,4-dienedioate hydrolase
MRFAFGLVLGFAVMVIVWWRFAAALRFHRDRVRRGSRILASRFGSIEFGTTGEGAPVLVIHGAGGGFDQVLAASGKLLAAGYQVIAPSRFGYLRSASPANPSPENQADAFEVILDELHIESLPIIGISAGALSALQFALRHPRRCRALTLLVPAASAVLPGQGAMPDPDPISKAILKVAIKSDFLFWLGIKLFRDRMIRSVLATDPGIVRTASPDERQRALEILWNILPLSERSQGLLNDARFVTTPQAIPVDQIRTPTLVVSLEDDYYRTLAPARFIAEHIPGARLITYSSGGHLWVGHDAEVFGAVEAFLKN